MQLSRKLLSWLFLRPIAKRQPSKPELRSITPNMRIPSDETAYSSRTTPIWRNPRASISFSTTAIWGMGLWVAVAAGVATRASSSRVSFVPYEHRVIGRSWGRYRAENCRNWLVLLDKGCLSHGDSSKNGNRESQQTKLVCGSPELVVPLPAALLPTATDGFAFTVKQFANERSQAARTNPLVIRSRNQS